MTWRVAVAGGLLAVLAACEPVPPEAGPTLPDADTCGAAAQAALVGQPAELAGTIVAAGAVRVIRPGDAVTMDYREDRLNVEIGEDGRVARLYCG